MKFKVNYHVGSRIETDTKLKSGTLSIDREKIYISGSTPLEIKLSSCKKVEMFRLHGLGEMMEISCKGKKIFLTVVRINIANIFININILKTVKLHNKIKKYIDTNNKPFRTISEEEISQMLNKTFNRFL